MEDMANVGNDGDEDMFENRIRSESSFSVESRRRGSLDISSAVVVSDSESNGSATDPGPSTTPSLPVAVGQASQLSAFSGMATTSRNSAVGTESQSLPSVAPLSGSSAFSLYRGRESQSGPRTTCPYRYNNHRQTSASRSVVVDVEEDSADVSTNITVGTSVHHSSPGGVEEHIKSYLKVCNRRKIKGITLLTGITHAIKEWVQLRGNPASLMFEPLYKFVHELSHMLVDPLDGETAVDVSDKVPEIAALVKTFVETTTKTVDSERLRVPLPQASGVSDNGDRCSQESPSSRKHKRSEGGSDQHPESPSSKKRKVESSEEDPEDTCAICLESWSTGGEHRITSLACGHIFGLSCITKWVEQAHSCPQCKAKAKKSDFRSLFVKTIMAEDSTQRDRAMKLLELKKEECKELAQSEAMLRRKLEIRTQDYDLVKAELAQAKELLQKLSSDESMKLSQPSTSKTPLDLSAATLQSSSSRLNIRGHLEKKFHLLQRIHISQEGQCRVMDFCPNLGMTVVSQKSANPLFRGFGVKMLSRDFRPLSYQPLHAAPIRDMSFQPNSRDGILLSCSMDKSVLLSSVTSKVTVQKFNVNSTVWSCAWDTSNTNLFYAGLERGVVREFDLRQTTSHVRDVLNNGGSPISNLQYWRGIDDNTRDFQGLLIAQLQNLIFKKQEGDRFSNHFLPVMKAPLMNLSLHSSGKFLTSFRPSSTCVKCRYEVSDLSMTDAENHNRIISHLHAGYDGGKVQAVMSRNSLISRPESDNKDDLLAVTADHANNTVNVWEYQHRRNFQTLGCFDKALDIKAIEPANDSSSFLAVLTDKDLIMYKWRS